MLMRLQKFLAEAGVASRRKSEEIILASRVRVNGEIVNTLGTKIDDEKDIVTLDGKEVKLQNKAVYIMLNKPVGCVTTVTDQFGRKTVMDYLKNVNERVYPVGRLDYDTSGLLLLTNDGDLTHRLTHPSHNIDKNYIALVKGVPNEKALESFRKGLVIDGCKTAEAKISVLSSKDNKALLDIKIHEGRNRQVRKMCEAIGNPVIKLKRIAIGNLKLGDLKEGSFRYLSDSEIEYLKNI